MKKIFIYSLFLLTFTLLFSSVVSADVIPPWSHSFNRCAKVVNLNEFPNIILIGYYIGPMVDEYETFQIENNKCLWAGYKFNTLSIYWNTKEKADVIDSNNLLLERITWQDGTIDKNNPLIKEDIEYSIAKISEGKFILYKSRLISEYNDGTPQKIENFQNPQQENITPTPSPKPVKRGFWQSIICFFKELFGRSCQ